MGNRDRRGPRRSGFHSGYGLEGGLGRSTGLDRPVRDVNEIQALVVLDQIRERRLIDDVGDCLSDPSPEAEKRAPAQVPAHLLLCESGVNVVSGASPGPIASVEPSLSTIVQFAGCVKRANSAARPLVRRVGVPNASRGQTEVSV